MTDLQDKIADLIRKHGMDTGISVAETTDAILTLIRAEAWQPIETAPKEGQTVLVCKANDADGNPVNKDAWGVFIQVASWWEGDGWVVYNDLVKEKTVHFEATHWMPLPEPPSSPQTSGVEP